MAFGRESSSGADPIWTREDSVQKPHWMKLLEERYQRLHAKIINQAARLSVKRHSTPSLKGATTRYVKESRQTTNRELTSQEYPEACGDFNRNLRVDEVCADEPSQVENSEPTYVSLAKENTLPNGAIKSDHTNKPPHKTALNECSSRGVPLTNCFENDTTTSAQETPRTSGAVTRMSSAFALTRLSSECDLPVSSSSQSSGFVAPAAELSRALQAQIGTGIDEERELSDNEENDNDEQRLFRLDDNIVFTTEDVDSETEKHFGFGSGECDNESLRCYTEKGEMEVSNTKRKRRPHRSVKTSVSRVSNKTSKSCPATMWETSQAKDDNNNNNNNNNHNNNMINSLLNKPQNGVSGSLLSLTPRGVQDSRMRVFARMSIEARHAIDETLKEMKAEEEASLTSYNNRTEDHALQGLWANQEVEDGPDGQSMTNNASEQGPDYSAVQTLRGKRDKEDSHGITAESDESIASHSRDPYASLNNSSVFRKPHLHNPPFISHNSPISRKSFNVLSTSKTGSRRLPHLDHEGIPNSGRLPNPHARLPGIGNFHGQLSFRENTFEITPPDFDIRFHQIIHCQTGDRDTPPLDIRQQAIEKCQQWLGRQSSRY